MNGQEVSEPRKSLPGLLLGTLLRPRPTFAHLSVHQQRSWWAPAVLILLCTVLPLMAASAVTSAATLSMPPQANNALEKPMIVPGGGGAVVVEGEMNDGYIQEGPAQPTGLSILKIGGATLGLPLTWLLWGGALYLASVFLGRSSSFAQMFKMTVWSWLPYALRGLLQSVVIWVTRQPITNKGFSGYVIDAAVPQFITPGPGKLALASILGRIDIFAVWNLALLVIGLMAFTKLPRRKATTAILVIWAVFAMLSVIPSILGGMFGSIAM